jgi:nucleoside-diphosphate-sugar epimerase
MHTILGINGVSGHTLAAALRERNIPVRGVSRKPHPGDWEHVQADVLNPVELMSAVDGSEVVYLVVGLQYDIKVWRRDWPVVMQNTIDACMATGAKLVFIDNVYPLGLVEGSMTEESPMHPISKKGKLRAEIDQMLLDAFKKGLRGCIARAADFYGPDCKTSVLNSTVFDRHAAGSSAFVMGSADKVHTFTYTKDIGKALAILGTDNRADGQIWNIPTASTPWTQGDWVRASAAAFGVKPSYMVTSTFMLRIFGLFSTLFREMVEMNYQYTHDYVLDSSKFERTFGLKPTPVEQGLAETVASYK